MAKKARAEAKRQKRLGRGDIYDLEAPAADETDETPEAPPPGASPSNDEIMASVEELHRRYDDGQLDLETFDEQRTRLMAQISVE